MTQSRDAETAAERPVGTLAEQLAGTMTAFAGSTTAFGLAVATIVVWAVTGPVFGYSDTWQLVINTGRRS